jgi:AraC-like DNA-binding protein
MSRSAFFERFARVVGVSPMDYLLGWRMTVAKDMLRSGKMPLEQVAERVGYGSASTFSTAFSRHVGQPPGRYARSLAERAAATERPISPRTHAQRGRDHQ